MLDPKNYRMWTALHEHPDYVASGERVYDWYVHVDPVWPRDRQRALADEDFKNLRTVCAALERAFGNIDSELIVQDDCTTNARVRHAQFEIEICPHGNLGEANTLTAWVERPQVYGEWERVTPEEIVARLRSLI